LLQSKAKMRMRKRVISRNANDKGEILFVAYVNSISEMVQFEFLYFKGSSAVPSTIQLFGWETK
jgi:hypothetical protein